MRRTVLWCVIGVAAGLFVVAVTLAAVNGSLTRDGTFIAAANIALILGYTVVGTLLVLRLPSNAIGWLMLAIGLGLLVADTWIEYAIYALTTEGRRLPFGLAAGWLGSWTGIVAILLIPLILLLFPTGHLPSRRWLPVAWGLVVCVTLLGLMGAFAPGPIDLTEQLQPENPFGISWLPGAASVVRWIAGVGLVALSLAAVAALVFRFRGASGEERQQLRWLAFVGSVGALLLVVVLLGESIAPEVDPTLVTELPFILFALCLAFGIPAAIAIALLKYHLYDLDLVIKKTVIFATCGVLVMAVSLAVAAFVIIPITWLTGDEARATGLFFFLIGVLLWPLWRLSRRIADRIVFGGRASPYEVLSEFSERMSESFATDDVLPRMARIVREAAGAQVATVWLRVGRELRAEGVAGDARRNPPVALPTGDAPALPGDFAAMIRHQGELLGALVVQMPANDPMSPSKEKLVNDLAAQAGLVLRNVRLIEELRDSRRRLVSAQDGERRKLERNIHDGAQQQLVALQVKQRLADHLIDRDPAKAHELMAQLQTDTTTALDDLRDLARGIYPPLLADKGLAAALEAQARRAPLEVIVERDGVGRYQADIESTVYFCCLEALTNIAKYAEASRAIVTLTQDRDVLMFEVRDDGQGFDKASVERGTGLQGMTDRLDAIDGTLLVESTLGQGTTVSGTIRSAPMRSPSGG